MSNVERNVNTYLQLHGGSVKIVEKLFQMPQSELNLSKD